MYPSFRLNQWLLFLIPFLLSFFNLLFCLFASSLNAEDKSIQVYMRSIQSGKCPREGGKPVAIFRSDLILRLRNTRDRSMNWMYSRLRSTATGFCVLFTFLYTSIFLSLGLFLRSKDIINTYCLPFNSQCSLCAF